MTIHQLPFSTANCDESPKIDFVLGKLNLLFDYSNGPPRKYAEIVFSGAIILNFTPDALVSEEMIDAYSNVCEYDASEWLVQCREKSNPGLRPGLKHYRVYFDHYGCVDVIAEEWVLKYPIE